MGPVGIGQKAAMTSPNSESRQPSAVVSTERTFPVSPARVFAAFEDPLRLAKWWGPNGFTNTFEVFDFVPDGRWDFVMHAPNGADYANESFFREIVRDSRIVIEHVVKPWFRLTVTLSALEGGTRLEWEQEFESPEVGAAMRVLSETANEQVLDRLQALLGHDAA